MKLKIKKVDLVRGLRLAAAVADKKSAAPIVACVLLRAEKEKGTLMLGATDLVVSATAALGATVEKDGAVALQAKHFYEVARELPGEDVALVVDASSKRMTIRAGRAEFTIPGYDSKDYPKLPSPGEWDGKVDAPTLREMIERTAFSISSSESRENISCLRIECHGGKAVMVSTDGHRLSKIARDLAGAPDCEILVPRKAANEMAHVLEGREAPVSLAVRKDILALGLDDVVLMVKLSDASFPPWAQVIPASENRHAVVVRTQLMESLARVAVMAMRDNGVVLKLSKGSIKIEAQNPDAGDAKEEIEAVTEGNDLRIGLNVVYLRDWLSRDTSEKVRISFLEELDPMVMRPADGADYVGVVMPLKI